MASFIVDLFLKPIEVYRQISIWSDFEIFLEILGVVHHIACLVGGYVWRFFLKHPDDPGPHHLFILTIIILEIGSGCIRTFIISGKRYSILFLASITNIIGVIFLITYGFDSFVSIVWSLFGFLGLFTRQGMIYFLFKNEFNLPDPNAPDSPSHVPNEWTTRGIFFATSSASFSINVGGITTVFVVYSLRMLLVEPLYTWLPYIPVVSPIYGQGQHYRNSSKMTFSIIRHILSGAIVCITGTAQFDKKIRHQFPALHRWSGRLYIVAGSLMIYELQTLRSITGTGSQSEPSASMQLFIDACTVCWVVTIAIAIIAILLGKVQLHRKMMLRNFYVSLVPMSQRAINTTLCFIIFLTFYPVFVALNFVIGPWGSGEWLFSIPGLGRFQEFVFPFSAWTGLALNIFMAEAKIVNDVDLWVDSAQFTKETQEKFEEHIPDCCRCWYAIRRQFLFIGGLLWKPKQIEELAIGERDILLNLDHEDSDSVIQQSKH